MWLKTIVGLRDSIMLTAQDISEFDPYHINLLRRVRNVASIIKLHLLPILEYSQATLSEFVKEYWADATNGSEINWRQADYSPRHVFFGLLY